MKHSGRTQSAPAWRIFLIYVSAASLFSGLLFSRALLSIGLILFAMTCLLQKDIFSAIKKFYSLPVPWSISILFLVPLITGAWSSDFVQWEHVLRIKLPLLLLPVCFAGIAGMEFHEWKKIAYLFIFITAIGVFWSLGFYLQDIPAVNAAYLKANAIQTPLENDHVRFSLLVAIGALTSIFLFSRVKNNIAPISDILLVAACVLFVFYLHVLAVRTGLVCFYMGAFVLVIEKIVSQKGKWRSAGMVLLLVAMPVAAFFLLPTFRNRIAYLQYDFSKIKNDVPVAGSNDGNRLFSIKAGEFLIRQHPVRGVGFGDIREQTGTYYEQNYPAAKAEDRILPSSEWLIYGAGGGWPGLVLFGCAVFIPLFSGSLRKNVYWLLLNLFFCASYFFDIGLEVQFGVFMHAFILLWWYCWLQGKE